MAEEQDIKQETVEETEDTTNVEEPTVEKTEEAVADAAQVLEELKADFDNRYKRLQADFENFKRRTNQEKEQLAGYVKGDVLTDRSKSCRRGSKSIPRWIHYDSSKFDGYVI